MSAAQQLPSSACEAALLTIRAPKAKNILNFSELNPGATAEESISLVTICWTSRSVSVIKLDSIMCDTNICVVSQDKPIGL